LRIFGHDTIIVRLWFEPLAVGSIIVESGWVVLFVPLRFKGRFMFSGCEAKPGRIFLSVGTKGYATRGERRDTIAIAIRRRRIDPFLRSHGIQGGRLIDAALDLEPAAFGTLSRLLGDVSDVSRHKYLETGVWSLKPAAEQGFIDGLLTEILPVVANGPVTPLRSDDLAIVRAAEQVFSPSFSGQPSLEEMYVAAGVGRTRLWRAFTSIYGISPAQYVIAWRLNRAREALLNQESPPRSVKDISLSLGFPNSGRFAKLYEAIFGELPSKTLTSAGDYDADP